MERLDIVVLLCYNSYKGRKRVEELKDVTILLINDFKIKELNHDMMGYSLQKGDIYTYHHLLIPKRQGGPISYENGAVLTGISHQYLHVIEATEHRYFAYITSEIQKMKMKGYLDDLNLVEIDNILLDFECKYEEHYTRKGRKLIRPEYLNRKFRC